MYHPSGRRKVNLLAAAASFTLILVTQLAVTDPALYSLAFAWMLIVPIAMRRFANKQNIEQRKTVAK